MTDKEDNNITSMRVCLSISGSFLRYKVSKIKVDIQYMHMYTIYAYNIYICIQYIHMNNILKRKWYKVVSVENFSLHSYISEVKTILKLWRERTVERTFYMFKILLKFQNNNGDVSPA